MRRLLPLLAAGGLLLALSTQALAGHPRTAHRLPSGITKINVAITFPTAAPSGRHRPVRVALTRPATVGELVAATNSLPLARIRGMCPMIMRIGPVLTVVFRNASGAQMAVATVDVTQGSRGDSGSSACFPIRLFRAGRTTDLLGNRWVRLVGRLAGAAIS